MSLRTTLRRLREAIGEADINAGLVTVRLVQAPPVDRPEPRIKRGHIVVDRERALESEGR